jgi:hypothetical protein
MTKASLYGAVKTVSWIWLFVGSPVAALAGHHEEAVLWIIAFFVVRIAAAVDR